MTDMAKADFTLTYDGPALRDHSMEVRDLAPAMLAVGELFDAMNTLLNGERAEVRVNVRAHDPGCFTVIFDIVQGWKDGALSFLTGDMITAAINLKDLLLGAGCGLVYLIKRHKGRMPNKVERLNGNMVRIQFGDETYDVPVALLKLYQDVAIRTALEKIVYRPLQSDGIDLVQFGERHAPAQSVTKAEAEAFKTPDIPEKILIDDTREAAYSILSLAFKEDNKWRLYDGSNPISATIEDEDFLKKVDSNSIRFAKGDVLICEVQFIQKQTAKGLSTDHVVRRVKRHIPAPRQYEMPIDE